MLLARIEEALKRREDLHRLHIVQIDSCLSVLRKGSCHHGTRYQQRE